MLPDVEFLYLDLYHWMHLIGIVVAMAVARAIYKRAGVPYKLFVFGLIAVLPSILLGYLCAALLQSWFSYLETGVFAWGVGSTFYGGLLGAVAFYLALYFGVGHFLFRDNSHIALLPNILAVLVPCIALAHAFGRIGCLFAGCCYGAETAGPLGMEMFVHGEWQRRIPVQLFEAIFLLLLFGALLALTLTGKGEYAAGGYLVAYGVWRFFIEYARDDDRGASGIPFLSPAQLISVLLVLAGIALLLFFLLRKRRQSKAVRHEKD